MAFRRIFLLLCVWMCVYRALAAPPPVSVNEMADEALQQASGGEEGDAAAAELKRMAEELSALRADAARQEEEQAVAVKAAEREALEGSATAEVMRESLRRVQTELSATKARLASATARYQRAVQDMSQDADRLAAARRVRDDVGRIKKRLEDFKAAQRSSGPPDPDLR